MANAEDGKSTKPAEKSSSPAQDQANVHVYPDWAAMQAYYGPRVAVPPYFNSALASGHAPHPYMWAPPQPMIPPYATPYAAIYAHGGVYAHPGVPIAAASLTMDGNAKSPGNAERGLMSKLRSFDGLAMSIGNGHADSAEGGAEHGLSHSADTEGSSDGSNGNADVSGENRKKRPREVSSSDGGDEKVRGQAAEVNGASGKTSTTSMPEKVMGTVLSPNMTTALELRSTPGTVAKISASTVGQTCQIAPSDTWLQSERELKRERRKQSNRESARRSRLRKQAETEELAKTVQSLSGENTTLKSELSKLTENCEKLKLENAALMERLKSEKTGHKEEVVLNKLEDQRLQPVGTANLLARVNNSGSVDRNSEETDAYENRKSGAKLHQLLDASPRTDAVAAG